jgi:THO complex subunit 4
LRPFHYKLGLTWKFAQDYFSKSVGAVKKVMLTYGPTGRSRGTATIVFAKPGSAAQAAHELNGVKVDNRAMKVCIPIVSTHYDVY